MNKTNNFALVPRPPSGIEKAEPGTKRVLSGMVNDALALVRRELGIQTDFVSKSFESADDYYWRGVECEKRGDHFQAFQFFKQAAERGDSWAQYKVGCAYLSGDIVTQDYTEAAKWIRMSAENGENVAQASLGEFCLWGKGIPASKTESAKWFSEATGMGKAERQALLEFFNGRMRQPKNRSEFFDLLRREAQLGNTGAQWLLGECYRNGWFVEEDNKEAARWFMNFAVHGLAEGQYRLGECYCFLDRSEQLKWLRRAAEQGHEMAQMRLTILSDDVAESYKWTRVFVNNPDSIYRDYGLMNLENRKEECTPEQVEKGEALAHEYLLKISRQPKK